METILENLLKLIPLAIIFSAVGYFIRRKVEQKPLTERLERAQKLLDLKKQMTEQALTLSDLDELETRMLSKVKSKIDGSGFDALDKVDLAIIVAFNSAVLAQTTELMRTLGKGEAQRLYEHYHERSIKLTTFLVNRILIQKFQRCLMT